MKTQSKDSKPKVRSITDHAQIAAVIARGKYRDHLPHYEVQRDGSLLVEVKETTCTNLSQS